MKKTLRFNVSIEAPKQLVWKTMLDPDGYTAWTAPFCEGSYFSGSWDSGAKIKFLAPGGDGMTSEIAENRPYERVSIRHLGEIANGVEDTTSEKVRAWAPAYESYDFAETASGCEVAVTLDTLPDYERYMNDTYPKALALLKAMCEMERG